MEVLIKNALLLDAFLNCVQQDVLISGERIVQVGRSLPDHEMALDLRGYTLMPGFIDAHVHVAVDRYSFSDEALLAWAQNGVTTVRELGMLCALSAGDFEVWLDGHTGSPWARVIKAGKYIDVDGGYGSGPDPSVLFGMIVKTPEQAADAVTYQFHKKSAGIKIGISDIEGPPGTPPGPRPRLSNGQIRAICDRAHSHGMWVSAHLKTSATLKELIACGIDDAAHTPIDPIPDAVIADAVARGVMFTTTIGNPDKTPPFIPAERLAEFRVKREKDRAVVLRNLKRIHQAGGVIAVGTDLMHSDDYAQDASIPVHELQQLSSIGLSMQDVIACATYNAARISHTERDEGSIQAGKYANLIAVRGTLDHRFSNLKNVPFVMNRGEIIKNTNL